MPPVAGSIDTSAACSGRRPLRPFSHPFSSAASPHGTAPSAAVWSAADSVDSSE